MAKAKSSKITIEDALVPVGEQPYGVPENWNWVKIGTISDVYTGNSINERVKKEKYEGKTDGPLFIATKDVDFDNTINYETNIRITDSENFKKAPAYTSLLCIEGGSAGRKIGFTNQEVCFGNKLCAFATERVNSKFIFYFLQSSLFMHQFNEKKHGLIGGVSVRDLAEIAIPIPPLTEQQRIVERIESLFIKLDEAKEKAMVSVERLDDEYQSILYEAFTGKLSNSCDVYNKDTFSYSEVPLSDLVSDIRYGSSEKSDYDNNGTPVLRIPNIEDGNITFEDVKFLQGELDNDAHEAKENDILIIRSNGSRDLVGRCALVPKLEKRYAYASFLMRIKTNEKVNPRYLSMYINSSMARRQLFVKAKSSSGIHNINSKELGAVRIYIPSIEEQNRIIEIVDELLSRIRTAKTISENVCSCIDEVKKSILAKAFRGELGTNDPSEESSIELLKQIIANE